MIPWAQLIRLPNIFTAPADVIAGAALAGCLTDHPTDIKHLFGNILASICLYAAGMIMNDLVDFEIDAWDRPERPLPSRKIEKLHALAVMLALIVIGSYLATNSLIVLTLSLMIIAYNLVLKSSFLGPLAMGGCRGFNLLLGACDLVQTSGLVWWGFWNVTVYITGVTLLAKDEVVASQKKSILLGIIMMMMGISSVFIMTFMNYQSTEGLHLILVMTLLAVMTIHLLSQFLLPAY
ncbi:MAG TPA: UbiA family prenyltransferase, partial [Gemmatales bacterium]|nr:UbiA family prenyltransferase [Gemmatales bacterium]